MNIDTQKRTDKYEILFGKLRAYLLKDNPEITFCNKRNIFSTRCGNSVMLFPDNSKLYTSPEEIYLHILILISEIKGILPKDIKNEVESETKIMSLNDVHEVYKQQEVDKLRKQFE